MHPKLLIAVCVFLLACSSAPAVRYYVLDMEASSAKLEKPTYKLRGLTLPSYLGHSGIVLRTDDNELRHAQYHRWGEPLISALRKSIDKFLLKIQEQHLKGVVFDLDIEHFYATPQGVSHIAVQWQAEINDCVMTGHIQKHRAQQTAGYDALVANQNKLIHDFVHALVQAQADNNTCSPNP